MYYSIDSQNSHCEGCYRFKNEGMKTQSLFSKRNAKKTPVPKQETIKRKDSIDLAANNNSHFRIR